MKHQDKIKKSINLFGPREELIKVCEELGELQAEVFKAVKGKADIEKILEELADVYFVLGYIKEIYHISDEELDEKMKAKVQYFEKVLKEKERDIYPEPEY